MYNNYFKGLVRSGSRYTGAVNIARGQINPPDSGYETVVNDGVVHNTFVNCDRGIWVSATVRTPAEHPVVPRDIVVANNIMLDTDDAVFIDAPADDPTYAGNARKGGSWDSFGGRLLPVNCCEPGHRHGHR